MILNKGNVKEKYLTKSTFQKLFKDDSKSIICEWNLIFRKSIIDFLKENKLVSEDFNNLENLHNEIFDRSILDYEILRGKNLLLLLSSPSILYYNLDKSKSLMLIL